MLFRELCWQCEAHCRSIGRLDMATLASLSPEQQKWGHRRQFNRIIPLSAPPYPHRNPSNIDWANWRLDEVRIWQICCNHTALRMLDSLDKDIGLLCRQLATIGTHGACHYHNRLQTGMFLDRPLPGYGSTTFTGHRPSRRPCHFAVKSTPSLRNADRGNDFLKNSRPFFHFDGELQPIRLFPSE